jgi:hypothetical protein
MRFDVSTQGELDSAMRDFKAAKTTEPMILVLHTPGQIAYRFIVNPHGIVRQECDVKGDPRDHDV